MHHPSDPIVTPLAIGPGLVEQITPLLEQLKASLADPTVQALRQRDAFHQAWDTAVTELLKNMEQIRRDITLIQRTLSEASNAGAADTKLIVQLIGQYHSEVAKARFKHMPEDPFPEPKRSWFSRLMGKLW